MSDQILIGSGEAKDILNVANDTFYALVRKGVIRKRLLPGMTYGKYLREDVERVAEAGMPQEMGATTCEKFCDNLKLNQKGAGL